jgi:putative Mg2+ transporter-C (MgtC) family protein
MHLLPLAYGPFLERLAIATALGLIIGLERQWRQRSAGLHTSTIVAVGAALFTGIPALAGGAESMRVIAGVVTGIGFLAGGVILRDGFNVRGLTTAATLWATAAVGALCGTGFKGEAATGAAVIVLANLFLFPLGRLVSRIPRASGEELASTYTLRIHCGEQAQPAVHEQILREVRRTSLALTMLTRSAPSNGTIEVIAELTKPGGDDGRADRLLHKLKAIDGVVSATSEAAEHSTG